MTKRIKETTMMFKMLFLACVITATSLVGYAYAVSDATTCAAAVSWCCARFEWHADEYDDFDSKYDNYFDGSTSHVSVLNERYQACKDEIGQPIRDVIEADFDDIEEKRGYIAYKMIVYDDSVFGDDYLDTQCTDASIWCYINSNATFVPEGCVSAEADEDWAWCDAMCRNYGGGSPSLCQFENSYSNGHNTKIQQWFDAIDVKRDAITFWLDDAECD